MEIFKRIQQAIPEFQEQSRIVVDCYGGGHYIGNWICYGVYSVLEQDQLIMSVSNFSKKALKREIGI